MSTSQMPAIAAPDLTRRRISRVPDRADAQRLVTALARWYVEFLAGRRPLAQVDQLCTPAVIRRMLAARDRHRQMQRRRGAATELPDVEVRHTALQWSTEAVCESVALVRRGPRTTALAIVVERGDAGWRVVELSSPEDGVAALRPPRPRPGDRHVTT